MAIKIEEFIKLKRQRKIITATVAADMLNYSVQNIYKLCEMGKLSGIKIGRRVYIYRDSVEKYLKEESEEF